MQQRAMVELHIVEEDDGSYSVISNLPNKLQCINLVYATLMTMLDEVDIALEDYVVGVEEMPENVVRH